MYKPLGNRVLIKLYKPEEKTQSGIYIHQEWQDLNYKGQVEAVGPAVSGIKKGQEVIYSRAAAVDFGDPDYRFVFDSQVALVCE